MIATAPPAILGAEAAMRASRKKAQRAHRRRLKRRDVAQLEVCVHKDDVALVRSVIAALADPVRGPETRALLRDYFGPRRRAGLKALLAAAPLEGSSSLEIATPAGMSLDRSANERRWGRMSARRSIPVIDGAPTRSVRASDVPRGPRPARPARRAGERSACDWRRDRVRPCGADRSPWVSLSAITSGALAYGVLAQRSPKRLPRAGAPWPR